AKRSQARSAGKVYVPPGHKLSCDPRLHSSQDSWQWAAIREDDGTQEYMSTKGSVLAVGSRSLFESAQLLGRDSRRAL
ncbi:unnamed protein product, partial [Ascophyllum nodosum]